MNYYKQIGKSLYDELEATLESITINDNDNPAVDWLRNLDFRNFDAVRYVSCENGISFVFPRITDDDVFAIGSSVLSIKQITGSNSKLTIKDLDMLFYRPKTENSIFRRILEDIDTTTALIGGAADYVFFQNHKNRTLANNLNRGHYFTAPVPNDVATSKDNYSNMLSIAFMGGATITLVATMRALSKNLKQRNDHERMYVGDVLQSYGISRISELDLRKVYNGLSIFNLDRINHNFDNLSNFIRVDENNPTIVILDRSGLDNNLSMSSCPIQSSKTLHKENFGCPAREVRGAMSSAISILTKSLDTCLSLEEIKI